MASARISNFRINNINSDEKKYLAEQQKRNILKQINNLTQIYNLEDLNWDDKWVIKIFLLCIMVLFFQTKSYVV